MITDFLNRSYKLFLTYLVLITLFFIYRLAFTVRYGEWGILINYSSDLIEAFIIGVKFDSKVICISLLFVIPLNLFSAIFKKDKIKSFIDRVSQYWILLVVIILSFILMIDHQYYTYFQTHINILVYGFIEDDTAAILKSIWTDHPILLITFILIFQLVLLQKVIRKIWEKYNLPYISTLGKIGKWSIVVLFIVSYAYGLRGNLLSIFPLRAEDAVVSENMFVNKVSLNGAVTLIDAVKERKENLKKHSKDDVLKKYNYASIQEALADYYGYPLKEFTGDYEKYLFHQTKTDSLIEKNQFNVVFILMESLGSYYLNFHSDKLNLLGEFEQHLNQDYHFKNFLSSTRGTIYSLESILINRLPPISNTHLRFRKFDSSVALPFHNAGYETIFVSGGKVGWRNLHELLPNQYFKQVYGESEILKRNENSQNNSWGVYDEYLFEEIFNQLTKNEGNPKLICALTTTNHTPYELPENYQGYSTIVTDSVKSVIIANQSLAEKSFRAYQYANDYLGKFLTKLKSSHLANNTIVAVTGDHNSYTLFPYDHAGFKEIDKHRVPFYLYLPTALQKEAHRNYLNRHSSHKDIFPTLFNLALSNQSYFSLGNDLLSEAPDSLFYGINESFFMGSEHLPERILRRKVHARACLAEYYFADKNQVAQQKR